MNRRQIREELFKLIYALHFYEPDAFSEQVENFLAYDGIDIIDEDDEAEDGTPLEIAVSDEKIAPDKWLSDEPEAVEEIRERITDIINHYREIDGELSERITGWTLDRIGMVELAILRLCIYEISFEGLAQGIAINEAVELAKKYGGENSGSFVNGVMARVINHA